MKKILLAAMAIMTMSFVAVYANTGKKPVFKKKAKTVSCCNKQNCPITPNCNKTNCNKTTCSYKTSSACN